MGSLLADWAPSGTSGNLRLAVRNGYLNFYRLGQSVSKVEFPKRGRAWTASIHRKYFGDPDGETYLKIGAEGPDDARSTPAWDGQTMLASCIAAAEGHAGCEKRHIDRLLDVSPRIIDLEIALPSRQRDGGTAPRIDIAALEDPADGRPARVVFWEVKRINDARLRSTRPVPEVVCKQIEPYERYVRRDCRLFEDAYRKTCRLLREFHCIASDLWETPRPLDPLIPGVADGERLEVDARPRLLIIEDEDPKSNWKHHLRKLENCLGDRVHLARPGQAIP